MGRPRCWEGDSNCHAARLVHLIMTMIKWIRTSRLSIKNSLSLPRAPPPRCWEGGGLNYCSPPLRQPRGKWMVSVVNSHRNATRIGWHLWEIDLRFAPGLPPGWCAAESRPSSTARTGTLPQVCCTQTKLGNRSLGSGGGDRIHPGKARMSG